jgi:hypothetical protein
MLAIRQIHEQLGSMLPVPAEAQNRRTEVIFLVVDAEAESSVPEAEGPDLEADAFCGALRDFPERAPQGEFESREEF